MRNLKRTRALLDRPFYSPREVAGLAGVHPTTVMNYIHSGRLYALRLSERTYRIPLRAVAKMLEPEGVRSVRTVLRPFQRVGLAKIERDLAREHARRGARR